MTSHWESEEAAVGKAYSACEQSIRRHVTEMIKAHPFVDRFTACYLHLQRTWVFDISAGALGGGGVVLGSVSLLPSRAMHVCATVGVIADTGGDHRPCMPKSLLSFDQVQEEVAALYSFQTESGFSVYISTWLHAPKQYEKWRQAAMVKTYSIRRIDMFSDTLLPERWMREDRASTEALADALSKLRVRAAETAERYEKNIHAFIVQARTMHLSAGQASFGAAALGSLTLPPSRAMMASVIAELWMHYETGATKHVKPVAGEAQHSIGGSG